MIYLKKASKSAESETGTARLVAERMLAEIEAGGEAAVRDYARTLDGWDGPILVEAEEIARAKASVPEAVQADIGFAINNVRRFAEA
ncbi:MAG TPA: histidinol dehydrogenase, partial [Acetobacteraceae bacterium]|nr:histidinol dehydrogenase [Acetobacteraceae bacterium]